MKNIKSMAILGIALLSLNACRSESVNSEEQISEKILSLQKQKEMEELSKLVGEVLKDKESRNAIIHKINEIDDYGNSISLALLLGQNSKITQYEKSKLSSLAEVSHKKADSSLDDFKESLIKVFVANKEDYPEIDKKISGDVTSKTGNNSLLNFIADSNLELYFPYEENHNWEEVDSYTVTYEDYNLNSVHEGVKFSDYGERFVDSIDDDYLYHNPSVALIPIDNDYLGEMVRYSIGGEEFLLNPDDGNYGGLPPGYGTQPPPASNPKIRLNYNVNPNGFTENHLLTTFIPKIRVRGTKWKRTLSKALRMKIAKVGSDVSVNPNGSLTALPGAYYFSFSISARDLRNDRWKDVNILWDPNWHKAKATQQMIVWSLAKNAGDSEISVNTKVAIDAQGNFTPTTTLSTNHKVSAQDKANFRGNKELDRVHVLTSIVDGAEYSNETYSYQNTKYSVRTVGYFDFFFVHDYTSL
ncbi:MAG: hypothetical protein Q4G16_09405 [Cruoricaptor ignavus]|nr:hypothetical protein [Cruoricaptor ignavus]